MFGEESHSEEHTHFTGAVLNAEDEEEAGENQGSKDDEKAHPDEKAAEIHGVIDRFLGLGPYRLEFESHECRVECRG